MDWETTSAEQALKWYFTEAQGACGMRSSQGGFEATMDRLVNCGPAQDGQIHLHETHSPPARRETPTTIEGLAAEFDAQRGSLIPVARARAIYQRLAQLSAQDRRTLELQYGCCHTMDHVSLSLAANQPAAQKAHLSAIRATRDRLNKKLVAKGQPKISAQKLKRRLTSGSTPRDFVLFLCASEADDRSLLDQILEQARTDLKRALLAYIEAGREAA